MTRTKDDITPADRAAGLRMKALREHWGVSQEALLKNRTQASNVETGSNLLRGRDLLLEYAEVFGVHPKDITAYRQGELSLEEFVQISTKKPLPGAAPPRRGRKAPVASVAPVEPAGPVTSSLAAATVITKEMADRVAEKLSERPGWNLERGIKAVYMVKGLTDPSEQALYNAAVVADLDAGGTHLPRTDDDYLTEQGQGRSARPSSLPSRAKATADRELTQTRQKRDHIRPR